MPLPRRLLVALVAALLTASPALAQDKPKRRAIPPPRPAATDPLAPPALSASAAPVSSIPSGLGATSARAGLVGLKPVGDARPACRAQCSKARYVCHAAGDAADCDGRWIPCLQACSAP